MKNLRLSICLLLLSATAATASNDIPDAVLKTFTQLYPEIESPFWEIRHDAIVATFKDSEGFKKAFFKPDGPWTETRIRMSLGQLPAGVSSFIEENYQEAEINFCGKVYTPKGIWYRVESELPGKVVLKTLDESGALIEEQTILFSTITGTTTDGNP